MLDSCEGLFTAQNLCGAKRTLAPLAPPRLSEPRKVEAEAQAVETNSETDRSVASIFAFKSATSASLINGCETAGTGSCQINSSVGTSGPK